MSVFPTALNLDQFASALLDGRYGCVATVEASYDLRFFCFLDREHHPLQPRSFSFTSDRQRLFV